MITSASITGPSLIVCAVISGRFSTYSVLLQHSPPYFYLYYISIYIPFYIFIFYFIVLYFISYATFYSNVLNFCTILYLKFSFYLCDFLDTYIFFSTVEASLRFKNFIASDCFYVIVVHMTIKILNLATSSPYQSAGS